MEQIIKDCTTCKKSSDNNKTGECCSVFAPELFDKCDCNYSEWQPIDEKTKSIKREEINYYGRCSHCGSGVRLVNGFKIQICPECSSNIKPCNLCDHDVVDCTDCPLDTEQAETKLSPEEEKELAENSSFGQDTQSKIAKICNNIKYLLRYKNKNTVIQHLIHLIYPQNLQVRKI